MERQVQVMFLRLGTQRQLIFMLCIVTLISILLFTHSLNCSSCSTVSNPVTRSMVYSNRPTNVEEDKTSTDDLAILCLDMENHLDSELDLPLSPMISSPAVRSLRALRFPYRYSHWKSSSILPRLLTPCEHNLLMHLLIIIDRICREYDITYFMSEGTLLGSLRHHDIIPWDDDVDIMVSNKQRQLFVDAIEQINSTVIGMQVLKGKTEELNYYKLFYKGTPNAGVWEWHFPFIDIFFYQQNKTHVWNMKEPGTIAKVKYVFPLMLRPLGQLWLPAPRQPDHFFRFDPFDECVGHFWDHRKEERKPEITTTCDRVRDVYPFVTYDNKTKSIEILMINQTVIHTVTLEETHYFD